MRLVLLTRFLLLPAVAAALFGSPLHAGPPEVAARPATGVIAVDGVLDEPAWESAGVVDDLVQQSPRPRDATPYRTTVRFLVDRSTLYVGFDCADPEPGRIAVHTMQRDGAMEGDDTLALVIAPFAEGRNGYLFRINAAAARADGLVAGPDTTSLDWDGVWDAATRRTEAGWTAEIALPARSLRFTPGRDRWRLEIERTVARERITLRWSGVTLDSKVDDFGRSGILTGLAGLAQGLGLSLSPFGLARRSADFPAGERTLKGAFGLDASYAITPQLDAVLTVNTDFAETEVDTRQVNLTRFPLYFPEKRPFFLEGSDHFEFGLGLSGDFVPFYSRRVGLFEDARVPIDAGAKLLGHAGPLGVAVLDVETGSTGDLSRTNLLAGRVTVDVDEHLRVGTVVTHGDPGGARSNTLVGLDAVWRTSSFAGDKNLAIGLWGARSFGDLGPGARGGWGLKAEYPNDLWDVALKLKQFGDALEPALGFLPRPGIRDHEVDISYQPRPERGLFGWVRQFLFELEGRLVTDLSGRTESWSLFTAPFYATTRSGEVLQVTWTPQHERLDEPFEVVDGIVIPPGGYTFHRAHAEARSSEHRALRAVAAVTFGGFFDGTLTQVTASLSWTDPGGHLQLGAESENDYGSLPGGRFITRLHQLRGTYSFSPALTVSTYLQYDTESSNLGVNARLRYTLRPGTDLFLVFTRDWQERLETASRFAPEEEQIVLKLRWTLRP